jgi:hypothetical protein
MDFLNFYKEIKIKISLPDPYGVERCRNTSQMILYCIEKTQISKRGPGCLCTPASTYGARTNS